MYKTVIFYHSDCDGHLSGAILERFLRDKNPIMKEINYGDEFPWDLIDRETYVWMADFSLQPWSDMVRLYEESKRLIWIDHHKTAIEEYDAWIKVYGGQGIQGLRTDGIAACRLCWEYCNPTVREPQGVYFAGEFDVWRWHDIEGALEYQYGLKLYETDPATEEGRDFWDRQIRLPNVASTEIIKQGKLLLNYQDRSAVKFMKKAAFETIFEGHNVIAVNRRGNSRQFDSVFNPDKHDFMLTFAWTGGHWNMGMYTEKEGVDVGAIAKKHGGGGHRGAAGFSSKSLPFELR